MSDHGHHDPGGHELEAINNKLLFRLLISLSAVTLLAVFAVIQWFYSQRAELQDRNAAEGSFRLQQYKEEMKRDLEGIEGVRKQILADPSLLAAPNAPAGWIHPDDVAGVPAAAGAAPAAAEATEPAKPAEPAEPTPAADAAEGEAIAVPAGEGAEPGSGEGDTKEPAAADQPIPVEAGKPEGDKPEKPADKPEGKPENKGNQGKGDENKAEKADKPANE